MVPLPLHCQGGSREVIARHCGIAFQIVSARGHGLGHLSILVAQYGPSVNPPAGHQHRHASHASAVLEKDTVPSAFAVVHDGSLCHPAAKSAKGALKDYLFLIRAVNAVCAVAHLSAYASRGPRNHQQIVLASVLDHAAAFQEASFCGVALECLSPAAGHHALHVGRQFYDVSRAVADIDAAVIVKEECGIVEVGQARVDCPRSLGLFCRHDVGVGVHVVVCGEEGIEPAIVIAERGGPLSASVGGAALHLVSRRVCKLVKEVAHRFPAGEVLGAHDGCAGHQVHGGGNHIIGVAHANDVGVGAVCPHHGVS